MLRVSKVQKYLNDIKNTQNYEKAFYDFISDSDIDINLLTFNEKKQIIEAIIKINNLQDIYDEINILNVYEKLYKTLVTYQDKLSKNIVNSLSNFEKILKRFSEINTQRILESITSVLQDFQNYLNTAFLNIFNNLPTNDVINKIRKSHKKWGNLGWTIIPTMDWNFFYEVPKTQKEADEKCMSIITKKDLKQICSYIYKNIKYRNKFNEARKCFESGYYVASSMILTSLIERKITELPLKNKFDKKSRGKKIIDSYKDGLNIVDGNMIELYYLENISSYLNMFLENGNDFKRQRYNVNRNFLMHGWRDVKTTKIDCIKLFLALYNIILLWENRTP